MANVQSIRRSARPAFPRSGPGHRLQGIRNQVLSIFSFFHRHLASVSFAPILNGSFPRYSEIRFFAQQKKKL